MDKLTNKIPTGIPDILQAEIIQSSRSQHSLPEVRNVDSLNIILVCPKIGMTSEI